ncbi:complex proteins associated with Set1p component shg1-domain-containing protein [Pyronema omphalodes]|nr:complex proteins associated with Set1p component shg1-domain-containing protein [Pyronema omphalodes]
MRSKKESGEDARQKELQKAKEQTESIQKDFKKRGHFDTIKKQVYAHFCGSDAVEELQKRLTEHTDSELNRDPSLRVRDRGKAAVLIERSAIQKGVYQIVEDKFKELLESRRTEIEAYMKELMVAQGMLDPSDDLPSFEDNGKDEKEEGDDDVVMGNGSAEDEKINGNGIPEKKESAETKQGDNIEVKREEPADIEMTDRALADAH